MASVERILKTFRGNTFNASKTQNLPDLAKESIYSGAAKEERAVMIRSKITLIRTFNQQIQESEDARVSVFEETTEARKGRAKKECIIIVARKLLQIIYVINNRNVPYNPNRLFVAKPNQ